MCLKLFSCLWLHHWHSMDGRAFIWYGAPGILRNQRDKQIRATTSGLVWLSNCIVFREWCMQTRLIARTGAGMCSCCSRLRFSSHGNVMHRERSPTSLCHISFVKTLYRACCVCVCLSMYCSETHIMSMPGTVVNVAVRNVQHDVMSHLVGKKQHILWYFLYHGI